MVCGESDLGIKDRKAWVWEEGSCGMEGRLEIVAGLLRRGLPLLFIGIG